ncbi:hypothetical protein [Rurimicrobium arvi]|uniref:Uncharacterized protein n=1 Tax=Rurimicrobium arvi TaxID=2049916 RepID=A0ABP8MIC7_9BACT
MKKNAGGIFMVLLFSINATAQPDTGDSIHFRNFLFDISGGVYSQQQSLKKGDATDILVPDYLNSRRSQEQALASLWGIDQHLAATDNPMGHGASYLRFHSWYHAAEGLDVYGSLEVNNGGFSWGPYNTYNISVLPRYYVDYKNLFAIGKTPLSLNAKIGYFENFKDYEGLSIYNIDMQGLQAAVSYKKLHLSATSVTDLQNSIGLNIDGTRTQTVSLEKLSIGTRLNADIRAGHTKYLGPAYGNSSIDVSAAVYNKIFRAYTQIAYRFNDSFETRDNYALLTGIKTKFTAGRWYVDATAEYRYYGGGYNDRFRKEQNTHYRKTDRPVGSNFTGDQVYPISYNNRPFSQWAVFTEYDQKDWVAGYTAAINTEFSIKKNFKAMVNFDFNWIQAKDEALFLYPFYKTGFKLEPVKGTYVSAYVTNRTLNLDKHYTTYYALKYPSCQLEFRRDIRQ